MKIIVLALIYISAMTVSSRAAEPLARSFAWPLKVHELDPHNTSSDTRFALIAHYLSPLLDISPEDNTVIPALAEKWSVSEDGKTITLHLRKDVRWSDGTRLTAQQAKRSIERALSPDMVSDAKAMLFPIEGAQARIEGKMNTPLGIEAPNSETIIFRLVTKQPEFLRVLAFPIASPIPTHLLDANSGYPPIEKLSSSGPYRLIKTTKHTAEFVANERYFGKRPHFSPVSFRFDDYKSLIKPFLDASLDTVEYIRLEQVPWLQSNMPEAVEVVKHNGAFYLVLKHENLSGFDHRVRQLLLTTLDFNRLNEMMTRNVFTSMSGLIPWGAPLASKTKEDSDNRLNAIKELKQLMEQRGYNQARPQEVCVGFRNTDGFKNLLNFLEAHLQAMHIKLVRKKIDPRQILKKGQRQAKDLCHLYIDGFSSRTRSEAEIVQSFLSGGTTFSPYLENQPELQKKVMQISRSSDVKQRQNLIKELEHYLLEENYVRAIYKADLIALVKQQQIANYNDSKTFHFIPLSQNLKSSM